MHCFFLGSLALSGIILVTSSFPSVHCLFLGLITGSALKLNLVPVSYWFENNDFSFFYKRYSGYYNFSITHYVKPKSITRSTRNICKLNVSVPFCRTKLFHNSYCNHIPKLWNNLPPCTRSSSSVSNFKTALYKYYLIALSNSFCPDT